MEEHSFIKFDLEKKVNTCSMTRLADIYMYLYVSARYLIFSV